MNIYPVLIQAAIHLIQDQGMSVHDEAATSLAYEAVSLVTASLSNVYNINEISEWLAKLPSDKLEDLCVGDQESWAPILVSSPPGTHALLDELFMQIGG